MMGQLLLLIIKVFLMVYRYALDKSNRNAFEFPTISTFAGSCVIALLEVDYSKCEINTHSH